MPEEHADVAVIGGSLGGVAAAYAAAKFGMRVVLVEETRWIGGQLTSQAVPPDEHRWIESYGATRTYLALRERIRAYYRRNYPLREEAARSKTLNPGNAWVSRLSHEPRVALAVLEELLSPYVSAGRIRLLTEHRLVAAMASGDEVRAVTVEDVRSKTQKRVKAAFFLDATELGELIALSGTEHRLGAESRHETGEPHAPDAPDRLDLQPITWVAAVEWHPDADAVIERPADYDFWRRFIPPYQSFPLFSWEVVQAADGTVRRFRMRSDPASGALGLFEYRRVIDRTQFVDGFYSGDVTLINWPQNDYPLGAIVGVDEEERRRHCLGARMLTLSLIYWLQTEAPRDEGGRGYPELRLRGDVVGSDDGLALYPYIRESRRIEAMVLIREPDVLTGTVYPDSIGIGHYALDLHPTIRTHTSLYVQTKPFEIPLGSLIPKRMKNMLPANSKLIGTTHLANGCYRLHPVEWNVGEVSGYLAAHAHTLRCAPVEVWRDKKKLQAFQDALMQEGVWLHWEDARVAAANGEGWSVNG